MDKVFRSALSTSFVENAIALCGAKGDRWLDDLPSIVERLEKKWKIVAGKPFRNLSYNYVSNAVDAEGRSVVLKIGLPLDDVEIFGEAAYLQLLDGQGTVRMLEFDRDLQAILIERAIPGSNLKSVCKKRQHEAVSIAIRTLQRIVRPVPENTGDFIRLDDWFDGLRRSKGTNFPQEYARKALEYYAELSRDETGKCLIHGDLHHDNILSARREPSLVIDPKGIIGHLGYDIGVFLNNHHDWLDWDTRLVSRLDQAVTEFATAFELETITVRKWAFCQMVLSWWWMFDEMPQMFGEELGLSDIWRV